VRVVGVHGVGQHRFEPATLTDTWKATALDAEHPLDAGPDKGPVGVPATPMWVQQAVQRLASTPGLQELGRGGVRRLARHMHAYLSHADAREQIWARVAEKVADSDEPIVLIGHSMGSMVGYEFRDGYIQFVVQQGDYQKGSSAYCPPWELDRETHPHRHRAQGVPRHSIARPDKRCQRMGPRGTSVE